MKHIPINFSPFASNVIDFVNDQALFTSQGVPVLVKRCGMGFSVLIDGKVVTEDASNISASYVLNQMDVGRMGV